MFEKTALTFKLVAYFSGFLAWYAGRSFRAHINRIQAKFIRQKAPKDGIPDAEAKNIVIVGASYAGYWAAKFLTMLLPPSSPFTVVVIEPHTHFHFTWSFARFCVVEGHEHKAFIPYGPTVSSAPKGKLRWIRDRVAAVDQGCVRLQSGEEIPYEYLLIATGATGKLPNRIDSDNKAGSVAEMKEMQKNIKESGKLVVVGGGAAGVELATDAKSLYPDKSVTLVHSRDAVLHRFTPELQKQALEGLQNLGVEVILGERLVGEDKEQGTVTLRSGRKLECDFLVNCAGQRPLSGIISNLAPSVISTTSHIRVKDTMQLADELHPRIYACGDVAEPPVAVPNPNSRIAFCQAVVAVDNILLATKNKPPKHKYKPHWANSTIKLTLGLEKTLIHITDDKAIMLWKTKGKIDLDAWTIWRQMGVKSFDDPADGVDKPV